MVIGGIVLGIPSGCSIILRCKSNKRLSKLTERIDAVVNCTLIRVKNKAKLTNFMI